MPRCKHKWVLTVPRVGPCSKKCSLCGKKKQCGSNAGSLL